MLAYFEHSKFERGADFSCANFESKVRFSSVFFNNRTPRFYEANFKQDTFFSEDEIFWPITDKSNAEDSKQAYTRLRKIAADLANPDLEHFFLRQEMRCKEVLAKGLENLAFKLFRWFSDFGISITRPTIALGGLWLGLAIAYYDAGFRVGFIKQGIGGAESMGLSFANLFSFLGLSKLYFEHAYKSMHGYIAFLSSAQTFLGVIFLFLLGLGLRNRFRLR